MAIAASDALLNLFIKACHRVAAAGLVRCSSGNLSCRVRNNVLAVSARGSWLQDINRDQVALCRLDDGSSINEAAPSVETQLHLGVMRARPDVHAVLHFQSTAATTIACGTPERHNYAVIPEIPLYVGRPGIVNYITPGSPQLAQAVASAALRHDVIIMRNHGLVAMGKGFDEVIQMACFMELACQIILHGEPRPLDGEQIAALKDYFKPELLS